jgi:hypothetical protein
MLTRAPERHFETLIVDQVLLKVSVEGADVRGVDGLAYRHRRGAPNRPSPSSAWP